MIFSIHHFPLILILMNFVERLIGAMLTKAPVFNFSSFVFVARTEFTLITTRLDYNNKILAIVFVWFWTFGFIIICR